MIERMEGNSFKKDMVWFWFFSVTLWVAHLDKVLRARKLCGKEKGYSLSQVHMPMCQLT